MSDEMYPWTRRPNDGEKRAESAPAYAAFKEYLSLGGDRSIRATSEKIGTSERLLRVWSSKWEWVDRSAAYDTYLMTAQVDGEADQFSKIRNKHLDVADNLLDHLSDSMKMWKPGSDPSIRWTTAFTAAAKVQHAALTLRENLSKTDEDAIARILEIVAKKGDG